MVEVEASSDLIRCETWPAPISRQHLRTQLTPREFRSDFARRLSFAEGLKQELRRHYANATRASRNQPFERLRERALDFWSGYEELNRRYLPEDPVYSAATQGTAASTTNSTKEFKSAAAGQSRILELFVGGEATVSAVERMKLSRITSSGTGTAPTVYTPELFNSRSPAAAGVFWGALTANVTWGTTQATYATNPLVVMAFNAFGGSDRWVAQPGEEIYSVNAEIIGYRSDSGTSIISAYLVVEEL